MKTITFKGTENQMQNLQNAIEHTDNELPKEVEVRVYVVDTNELVDTWHEDLIDKEFMKLAEEEGRVYTLQGFRKAFNLEEVNSSCDVIRFIEIKK